MLQLIGGLLGGIGGAMGNKSSSTQTETFEKDSTSVTDAKATDLSPELLKSLEGLFQGLVKGGTMEKGVGGISSRLDQLLGQAEKPGFDVSSFTQGIADQARSAAGIELESGINDMLSASGITESGNSMGALLANKLRNQTAANFAGITSQATATGEGIRQAEQGQITEGIMGLGTGLSDQILQLVQSTRGASTAGTSKTKEKTTGKSTIKGTSTQKTNPFSAFASALGGMSGAGASA